MKQIWRRMTAFFLLLSMLTACATAGEYDQNGAAEDTPAVLSAQALPEAAEEKGATGEPQGEAARSRAKLPITTLPLWRHRTPPRSSV